MKERIRDLTDNLSKTIVGKEDAIRLVLVAMLSGGHVLLEDVPGVGKTLLAKSLARSVNGRFQRIQCTPDLLPSDITGTNIWNPSSREFEFLSGPVFANVLLADEINRATPRTQSALLEVMEEQQVTVDGEARKVPKPFFVIATQNPIEYQGTFPLPEAQMDRFILSLTLGYPGFSEEVDMLQLHQSRIAPEELKPCISLEEMRELQSLVNQIHVEKSIQEYIVKIVQKSRNYEGIILGVSPRGTVALQRAAQAYAFLADRDFITTDDIKYLAPFVLAHRVIVTGGKGAKDVIKTLVATITDPSTPNSDYSLPTT
ncbi:MULTISPECIES: MoxR family ATPase [Cyanophyceae]|uniref:AAA family ATPase n=1 Tax=Cyanophyceae TaxID=3028117 RepID=UPI00016DCC88|nr:MULTISPECIES: MoxR family ATPase [Cyanophyceae]ACB00377.1 methanol dehydrogenase regulatory protein, MoxR-like ATPase [Picosynechococcus sp. PCC 7002]AMA09971.1 magnesium chelatase [Picosynechococcus sp. PCC 73109]ANV91337.1 magnesium chelatase [Picosynechococcus sp. PCC 8807]QCS48225.1 MoxR family ATPase [Picosynechococcus sp. PCC 11901]SMH48913.1 MoxR-like ATPase [Picosynechococcus sp. OG1]